MSSIGIVSTGSYVPTTVVTNEEIGASAGVTSEWIVRKTGIQERRRAAAHEATSDLAAHAARNALAQAGLRPEQLSFIVLATSTPDHPQPATASIVQGLIGATNAAAFDVNAVCSGFVYALTVADRMLDGRLRAAAGGSGWRRFTGEHPPPRRQRDPVDTRGRFRDARGGEVALDRRGVRRGRGGADTGTTRARGNRNAPPLPSSVTGSIVMPAPPSQCCRSRCVHFTPAAGMSRRRSR
ncbi:hypothetical protein [Streptomyces sp. NPDC058874]|uniref:hypothetical protein n=1 Tax=unclassified Streptomyces TaxID=2593676 RepID=UPI0036D0ED5A